MGENGKHDDGQAEKRTYSTEQIAAYHLELQQLLDKIALSETHYDVLGVDALATTGEIKLAYTRASALLNPSYYDLELPQPDELLPKVDSAFEKVSAAFSVLINFTRRAEYDDSLFDREEVTAVEAEEETPAETVKAPERRRHQRFELSLPVRVSGYSQGGGGSKWQEMTQSVDVSVSGASLPLSMPVRKGMILTLSMPMPATLRSHGFFESSYEVYAIVRRLEHQDHKTSLVGLEFLGEQPPTAYFEKPWGIFQTETLSGAERRKAPRRKKSQLINIDYLDSEHQLLSREVGTTEDISELGMRLCSANPPANFAFVKVYVTKGGVEKTALVTNRFTGKDGLERLCLQFVEGFPPAPNREAQERS